MYNPLFVVVNETLLASVDKQLFESASEDAFLTIGVYKGSILKGYRGSNSGTICDLKINMRIANEQDFIDFGISSGTWGCIQKDRKSV